jgi:hypothetical protein|tara:strand:+ start:473 stop:1279 length:807 start_codon:yes stop_codon:yes gene_type:complete
MKYALLVGINKYKTPGSNLKGCVNDVKLMKKLCKRYGYKITILKDRRATQKNIIKKLTRIINKTKAGDRVMYYHSGHGAQVPDFNKDEIDGLDECLVTYDHNWNNAFTDDKLASCLKNLHKKAFLSLIIDTCHSGTITDATGIKKLSKAKRKNVKAILMPENFSKLIENKNLKKKKFGVKNSDPNKQRHILIAGCKESQYSYEVYIRGKAYGLMTWWLFKLASLKKTKKMSWAVFHKLVYAKVRKVIGAQHPVISGKKNLRKRRVFLF